MLGKSTIMSIAAWLAAALAAMPGCQVAAGTALGVSAPSVAVSAASTAGSAAVENGRMLENRGDQVRGGGRYFDFPDILIPAGLSMNQDRTSVFSVGKQNAGVMVFDGYLDPDSLAAFFTQSMANNGWNLVGAIQMPAVKMFFSKSSATCVISINDAALNTEVILTVTPTR